MENDRLYPRLPNPWTSPWAITEDNLPSSILALVVESLLYGVHVILFGLCVRIFWRRRRILQILMLVAVTVMFCLATADIAVSWNIAIRHTTKLYRSDTLTFYKAIYPKFIIYLFNNVIADILLIIRCYVVWGKSKIILYLGGLVLLVGTAFGILSEATTAPSLKKYIGIYIVTVLVLNVGITLLTVGKILWIAREVKSLLGAKMVSHYHFAIGVLVESGLLYSASFVLIFILSPTWLVLMTAIISIRLVCIVPILLVVQIALGQATKSVQATVSELRVASSPIILDTIISDGGHGENDRTHEIPDRAQDIENSSSSFNMVQSSLKSIE